MFFLLLLFFFVVFFLLTKARPRGTLIDATRQLLPWNHFLTPPKLPVSSRSRVEWKEDYLEKIFEKFGSTSQGCRVCLGTSGNADPFTTGSCRKFKPEVMVVLVHKDTVLSKGVFERRTPIRSGLFAFMSKFIKSKYSHSTNVVASHDGTLKWKCPHFRLTCAVQKRLCLSSILGQWCVSLTPNNTKTIERMTCHCFLRPIRRDLKNSSYTTALLGVHKNHGRQNEGRRPFLLDKKKHGSWY